MRRCGSPAAPSACDSSGNRLVRSSTCSPPCLLRTKRQPGKKSSGSSRPFKAPPDSKHPPSSSSARGPDKRGGDHRPYTSRPVQNTGVLQHAELTLLEESLDHIRAA